MDFDARKDEEGPYNAWWIPKEVEYYEGSYGFGHEHKTYELKKNEYKIYRLENKFEQYTTLKKDSEIHRPPYVLLNDVLSKIDKNKNEINDAIDTYSPMDNPAMNDLNDRGILQPIKEWIEKFGPLGVMLSESNNIIQAPIKREIDVPDILKSPVDTWFPGVGWKRIWVDVQDAEIQPEKDFLEDITANISISARREGQDKHAEECVERKILNKKIVDQRSYFLDFFDPVEFKIDKGFSIDILPTPLSPLFYRLYREPVAFFIEAARYLCNAIKNALDEDEEIRQKGRNNLQYLASPANFIPEGGYRGGQFKITYSAPSLLSSLACWAILDLVKNGQNEQARVFLCEEESCRKLHASAITRKKFCSTRCKNIHALKNQKRKI